MLVIGAGVIMNFLLAISIFWAISYVNGKATKETTEIGYVGPETPAAKAGLLQGDKILSINGRAVEDWEEVENQVYIENLGNDITFDVERNGRRVSNLSLRNSIGAQADQTLCLVADKI